MVRVYSKPAGCHQCILTKKELDKLGVPYEDIDVTSDQEAFRFITEELGYSSVPVVVAGDQHWSGLIPDRLKALAA